MVYLPMEQYETDGEGWLKSHESGWAREILRLIWALRKQGKVITFHEDKKGHYIRVNGDMIRYTRNNGEMPILVDGHETAFILRGRLQ